MLSVLFVCTGNICRSPLAEALLETRSTHLGLPISVGSAGTLAGRGNPATPDAVTAAREMGAEIGAHRARPLAEDLVRRADLVLGLTREHRDEVVELVSEAAGRTFTLKELAALLGGLPAPPAHADREEALRRIAEAHRARTGPGAPVVEDPDVRDPVGRELFVYRDVASDIEVAVEAILAGLFGARQEAGGAAASGGG